MQNSYFKYKTQIYIYITIIYIFHVERSVDVQCSSKLPTKRRIHSIFPIGKKKGNRVIMAIF